MALLCAIVIKTNSNLKIHLTINKYLKPTLILAMVIMLVQVVFGTQVREAIDVVSASHIDRSDWISSLGSEFLIHRSFSWVVLLVNLWVIFQFYRSGYFILTVKLLFAVLLLTLTTGIIMAYLGVPAFAQPLHLLLGTLGFGLQFFLFLQLDLKVSLTV